jgi:hypothetical protein
MRATDRDADRLASSGADQTSTTASMWLWHELQIR